MAGDPVDILTWAAEAPSRAERIAGYQRALETLDHAASGFDAAYASSARARALCGLARDGAAPIEMAVAEVDRAVTLGGPCFALLSLAEAHSALRNPRGVLETIRRVPKTCFRSPLLAVWRFRIWDLRARASFDLGRVSEGLRYAGRLVDWMERDDPRELAWAPPHQTVDALQRLAAGDGPAATRARAVLAEIAGRIDLEDWFGPRGADRILTIVAQTAYSQT